MAITLTDVARRAGVSLATASRVINGSDRIPAEDVTQRVRAAADELGYVANAQAQALARSATRLLGLVVHDIADPYFSTIARGVTQAARDHHRQVLLAGTDSSEHAEADAVSAFASYRTDAIILAGSRTRTANPTLDRELSRYVSNGGRVVSLGPSSPVDAPYVDIPNEQGAYELATALIQRGVSRFAVLSGPAILTTAVDRTRGFLRAIAGAGLDPVAVIEGSFDSQGGYDAAVQCWKAHGGTAAGPTLCLLAANDVMALGAMTGLRSLNLKVPEDVLVAGFDDIPTLRDHVPGLSTYRLPLEAIGQAAAKLALNHQGQDRARLEGDVVLRESTNLRQN